MTAEARHDPVRQAVDSTGQSATPGVARQLSDLARELQADLTTETLLQHIVSAAVTEVPGARYAGITLVTGKEFATAAASGELVERLDRVQYETGEGPCLDAARYHETVRCNDLRADAPGPGSPATPRASASGRCCHSSCSSRATARGAEPVRHEARRVRPGQREHRHLAGLARRAGDGRRADAGGPADRAGQPEMIGQAKGILMERYKITGVQAFGLLVASSQAMNRKLRDIAEHLVATGELLTPSH